MGLFNNIVDNPIFFRPRNSKNRHFCLREFREFREFKVTFPNLTKLSKLSKLTKYPSCKKPPVGST